MTQYIKIKENGRSLKEIIARVGRSHIEDCDGNLTFNADGTITVSGLDDPKEVNHVVDQVTLYLGPKAGEIMKKIIEEGKRNVDQ